MDPSAENQPDPKVDAVIANITQLMREVEEMLAESTSQHAEAQIELLSARCEDLRAHLAACCTSAGQILAAGVQRTDRTIRDHPYESLLLALGAGLWCGVLLARRER